MKVLTSLNFGQKVFLTLVCCALLQGCVSTSLEDASPRRIATSNLPTALDKQRETPLADAATQDALANTDSAEPSVSQRQTLNTDVPAKYDEQGYPTFAETPQGEVDQLSSAEKIAIETKMTELLLSRANDENVRANFEAKLRRLRNLAKTHEQNADVIISQ